MMFSCNNNIVDDMSDVHTPITRSYNMSMIHGKDTRPEIKVRKYLFSRGFRFRKNDKRFIGKPDIVLPKYKAVIFVNGCFWHGHEGCKYFVLPKSNITFWQNKISRNIERDKNAYQSLESDGWKVITIWECQLKKGQFEKTMSDLELTIKDL